MNIVAQAKLFSDLHRSDAPLVLYNAWDAGSAKALQQAGALAIGTSSWSMAEAQGFRDGQHMPFRLVLEIVSRIVSACTVPVTVDFEGGYSEDDAGLATNVEQLIDAGVVGINFEDGKLGGTGLHDAERQAERIRVIRAVADKKGVPLFINARTDVFLSPSQSASSVDEAISRASAYQRAGASGFFVPGLAEATQIQKICEGVSLPVNVMVTDTTTSAAALGKLGVARVSYGPTPFIRTMALLQEHARQIA